MSHALARVRQAFDHAGERARMAIVLASALALILAGDFLPL